MSALKTARLRSRVAFAAAASGATALGASVYAHRARQAQRTDPQSAPWRLQLPRTAVEALAGAVGEVTQILALYPLDTIKVRCQAMGMSSGQVLKDLLSHGLNLPLLRTLYAGALGAALCSVLVGAVHFASFESSRRFLLQHTQPPPSPTAGAVAGGERHMVNVLAAAFAALVTAVVESPVELFRHNQQAGLVKGEFLREMVTVVKREGPAGLYWGFLPHCFEAWPHDISELWVYGSMTDLALATRHPASTHPPWLASVPLHAWDLCTGAASGAAAVLISMPFDCIKTFMQTHGTDVSGSGLRGGTKVFLRTGARMVRRGGVGALYYGVVPRLLQQVPSSMICWYVIHAVQRMMEPYTAGGEEAQQGQVGQGSA